MINEQKIWRHIGALSLVIGSWAAFIFFKSIYAWAIIPVFAAIAMMIGNPRAMLWWGLGWFMIAQYIGTEMRVGFLGYIDEFITLGMLGVIFFLSRRKDPVWENRQPHLRPLPKIAFLFLVLTLASAVINRSLDIYLLMWCFQYLRMFIILFFTARFVRQKDAAFFIQFMMGLSVVQFLLNLGWKLHINPLPNVKEWWGPDFGVGTLGGCDSVAYFCLMVMILCLSIALDPPSRKERNISWAVLVLTFINFMMTNTNHAYLMLAGILAIFFILNKKEVTKIISAPTLVGICVVVVVFMMLLSTTDAGRALRPEYLRLRYDQFIAGPKIESYRRNFTELPGESSFFWIAGHGPGKAGSCIGTALRRPIGDKYFNTMLNEEKYRRDVLEGSVATGPATGLLAYWSELGPLGLFLIILTYFTAFSKSRKVLKNNVFADKYQEAIARSLPAVFALVLMIALLRDLMYMAWLMGVVWTWAVLAFVPFEKKAVQDQPQSADSFRPGNKWARRAVGV